MPKILLIDDHRVILDGLKLLLETFEGFEIVDTSTDGRRANALVRKWEPDVVVTDAAMPEFSGLDVVHDLGKHYPQLPVLVLTTFDDASLVHSLMKAGAAGYILKDVSPEQLAEAITQVAQGGVVLDPRVARFAYTNPAAAQQSQELAILTRAERTVAELVAQGANNAEIASTLHLAEGTVKNHVSSLLRKLQARDRTVLALHLARALNPQDPVPGTDAAPRY